jgi:hypothetical protein
MPRKVLTRGAVGAGLGGLAGGRGGAEIGGLVGLAGELAPALARSATGRAMNAGEFGPIVQEFLASG